ncbi:MAG: hypothetical protein ACKVJE_00385 [Pseudomonadales bacterium]
MSFLLRKVSLSKWEHNKNKCPEEFTADAITGCTRTSRNTLSVWNSDSIDFNSEEVKDLVVALAVTMPEPAAIDLLWLEQSWLEENGIDINATLGESLYQAINDRHRDLENLNHKGLAIVGQHIVERLNTPTNYIRWPKPDLIKLVAERSERGDAFDAQDLSDRWIEALNKYYKRVNAA